MHVRVPAGMITRPRCRCVHGRTVPQCQCGRVATERAPRAKLATLPSAAGAGCSARHVLAGALVAASFRRVVGGGAVPPLSGMRCGEISAGPASVGRTHGTGRSRSRGSSHLPARARLEEPESASSVPSPARGRTPLRTSQVRWQIKFEADARRRCCLPKGKGASAIGTLRRLAHIRSFEPALLHC